jgi:hypothetical protein
MNTLLKLKKSRYFYTFSKFTQSVLGKFPNLMFLCLYKSFVLMSALQLLAHKPVRQLPLSLITVLTQSTAALT